MDLAISLKSDLHAFKIAKQNYPDKGSVKAKGNRSKGRKFSVAKTGKEKKDGDLRRNFCELHSTTDPMCFGGSPNHDCVSQYLINIF